MAYIDTDGAYNYALKNKTIQRAYNFLVTFENLRNQFGISPDGTFSIPGGPERTLLATHIKNVSIPTYSYKQEIQQLGQFVRSTPVLNTSESLLLKMELIEDDKQTITYFIHYLQSLIIDSYGFYNKLFSNADTSKNPKIKIEVIRSDGMVAAEYNYYNCYFLDSSEVTYDYTSNTEISYTLTMAFDAYSVNIFDNRDDNDDTADFEDALNDFSDESYNSAIKKKSKYRKGQTRGVLGELNKQKK